MAWEIGFWKPASFGNGVRERMNPKSGCYFVPGVQVWERHFYGKNIRLLEKGKKADITDKYKILVP